MDDPNREMRDLSVAHGAYEELMSAVDELVVHPFELPAGRRVQLAVDRMHSAQVREALAHLMDVDPERTAKPLALAPVGGGVDRD